MAVTTLQIDHSHKLLHSTGSKFVSSLLLKGTSTEGARDKPTVLKNIHPDLSHSIQTHDLICHDVARAVFWKL